MYKNSSLKKYLDDLAAGLPVPGGGSAAALVASLGVALISMVIRFTLGRPKYAKYQTELKRMLAASERTRKRLLELVDLDIEAFESKKIEKAIEVPQEVARLCWEAMKICPALVNKGNINLISDVAVACALLESGFSSALFNVEINLKCLKVSPGKGKAVWELRKKKDNITRTRRGLEAKINEIIRR
jgi:formiminotetrahydrofolate cyclodeaminase